MKLYFAIIEPNGNVEVKGIIEGATDRDVFKSLIAVQLSGMKMLQEVKDCYDVHLLHDKPVVDVMAFLAVKDEEDEDRHVEDLNLAATADDVGEYFANVLRVMDGPVGTDHEEVTEDQTIILVKLA